MNNELLEALQSAKTGNTLPLFQWKENTICEKMIADINDLLLKQRMECSRQMFNKRDNSKKTAQIIQEAKLF
jgi:hypothetical protein